MSAVEQILALPPTQQAQVRRALDRAFGHRYVYVYAIQAGASGPVKIGVTISPPERIKTLQQANAEELRGIACWRAPAEMEKLLHREFAHAHIRGEWFRPVPELLEAVHDLGGGYEDWTE